MNPIFLLVTKRGSHLVGAHCHGIRGRGRHEAAKRAWRSSPKPTWPDEATYATKIRPRLAAGPISTLSSKLGVCESYAADIRASRPLTPPALADVGTADRARCK
jgi:hypothetical protein